MGPRLRLLGLPEEEVALSTHDHGAGNVPGGTGGTGGHDLEDDFGVYDVHYYRGHFDAQAQRPPTHTYEQHARTGYALGHAAAANPAYRGRTFEEVDTELRATYKGEENTTYETVREYARHAFDWRTILGGLALAAGGWWASKQIPEVIAGWKSEDETHYHTHYQTLQARTPAVPYERARVGYSLGHVAARNPAYTGRPFTEVEPEIRSGFTGSYAAEYDTLRDYCRYGYERSSGLGSTGSGTGGTSGGMGTTPGTTGGIA